MKLLAKAVTEISEADLEELVTGEVVEHLQLEYKRELPRRDQRAKREFLYDVTSFANAIGGLIIYGVPENDRAAPAMLAGLEGINPEAEISRLEQMLLSGVQPRLRLPEFAPVVLGNGRVLIVVRVRQSWTPPHMVTLDDVQRFYARRTTGRYLLDVSEIRAAFLGADRATERIRDWRLQRLAAIDAGVSPVGTSADVPKVVLHLVPLSAGRIEGAAVDLSVLDPGRVLLRPMAGGGSLDWRRNFDGFLCWSPSSSGPPPGYSLMFRSGAIETTSSRSFSSERRASDHPIIRMKIVEREVMISVSELMKVQEIVGLEPPLFVMVSLLRVFGHWERSGLSDGGAPIDRNELLLPELRFESFDADSARSLRPAFDVMWQAVGLTGSPSFDESGTYRG